MISMISFGTISCTTIKKARGWWARWLSKKLEIRGTGGESVRLQVSGLHHIAPLLHFVAY